MIMIIESSKYVSCSNKYFCIIQSLCFPLLPISIKENKGNNSPSCVTHSDHITGTQFTNDIPKNSVTNHHHFSPAVFYVYIHRNVDKAWYKLSLVTSYAVSLCSRSPSTFIKIAQRPLIIGEDSNNLRKRTERNPQTRGEPTSNELNTYGTVQKS